MTTLNRYIYVGTNTVLQLTLSYKNLSQVNYPQRKTEEVALKWSSLQKNSSISVISPSERDQSVFR